MNGSEEGWKGGVKKERKLKAEKSEGEEREETRAGAAGGSDVGMGARQPREHLSDI